MSWTRAPLFLLPLAVVAAHVAPVLRAPADSWESRSQRVAAACGLSVRTLCEDGRCVTLAEVPNLDNPLSWVPLSATSGPMVGQIVAHDWGIRRPVTPCGVALRELGYTDIRERTQGRWTTSWLCVTQGAFSRSRWLCEELGARSRERPFSAVRWSAIRLFEDR